jgi:hypothetical protein
VETARRNSLMKGACDAAERRLWIAVADDRRCEDSSDPPEPTARTSTSRSSDEPVIAPSAIAEGVIASNPSLAASHRDSMASIYFFGVAVRIAREIVNQVFQLGREFRLGFQTKKLGDGRIVRGGNFLGFNHQPFQRDSDHGGARDKMVVLEEMRDGLGKLRRLEKGYAVGVDHLREARDLWTIGPRDHLGRKERTLAHRNAQHFFLTHGFQESLPS